MDVLYKDEIKPIGLYMHDLRMFIRIVIVEELRASLGTGLTMKAFHIKNKRVVIFLGAEIVLASLRKVLFIFLSFDNF